jgi:hypothetical protein
MRSSISKRLQQLELTRQIQQVPPPRVVCLQTEPDSPVWSCGLGIGLTENPPPEAILFRCADFRDPAVIAAETYTDN